METSQTNITATFSAGDRISTRGEDVNEIYILLKGHVKAMTSYGTYYLGPGSAIGLCDCYFGAFIYNYFAEDDIIAKKYSASSISDISKVLIEQQDNISILTIMQSRFIGELIKSFLDLNFKCKNIDPSYQVDTRLNKWELDKYNSLPSVPTKIAAEFYKSNISVSIGSIYEGARFIASVNDACSQLAEKLNINMDYVEPESKIEEDFILALDETSAIDDEEYFDEELALSQINNSLARILDYSEIDIYEADKIKQLIVQLRDPSVQTSLSDEARQLRRNISKQFYDLYLHVFFKAVNNSSNLPVVISMFLNFGFLDEKLLSKEQSIELYKLATACEKLCTDTNVFTIYSWLREIYWGDKEPSKNALDMDYYESLNNDKKSGRISAEQFEKLEKDNKEKVKFEVENMFTSANRAVFGRGSTFCPVLTGISVSKSFSSSIATVDKLNTALNTIRNKDFSAYYRDISYNNKEAGVEKEFIMIEVLPNMILLPTIGTEGLMWQEIEGRKKDTPSRMLLPIFPQNNLINVMVAVTGRFRWEMCKRSQGVYWNDLTEPSLTAEYCDYIQFYKKNRELSDSVKEKIKTALSAAHNNYREMFVKDYETWMFYEAAGSLRLNKISRKIIATYCPFTKEIRTNLKDNPLMKELIEQNNKFFTPKLKHIELVIGAMERKEKAVPKEIYDYRDFLKR